MTTQTADSDLVRRAREGDLDAFARLVERHQDAVHRLAARMVGPDDAQDVAQDAFLRAFHRLDRLRSGEGFRPWLLRIAQNAALDALRREALRRDERRPADEEVAAVRGDRAHAVQRTPARLIEDRERRARLAEKLGLLRTEHRAVLVLRDLEGLPYEEIAEVLDTPLGTVKGRLHRARAELIEILRHNAYDWELPG